MIKSVFKWDRFIIPKIIKFFYYLNIGIIAIFYLYSLYILLTQSNLPPLWFLASLLGLIISFVFLVLFIRLICEIIYVIFRINENLETIRKNGGI